MEATSASRFSVRRVRWGRIAGFAAVGLAIFAILELLGIDVIGWGADVISRIADVDPAYLLAGFLLKLAELGFAALGYTPILRAAFPKEHVPHKTVFGIYTFGVAIDSFAPAKAGSLTAIGLFRISIPNSNVATLVAASLVQSIAFTVFGILTWIGLLFVMPEAAGKRAGAAGEIASWIGRHPWLAVGIAVGLGLLAFVGYRALRPRLANLWVRLELGAAILRTPGSYAIRVFLPSLASFACRFGFVGVMMAAFGVPVTFKSVFLIIASNQIAGSIPLTPGGLGTTQALNCVALEEIADCNAVTAYSLSQSAVSIGSNIIIGLAGMSWAFGWAETRSLVSRRKEILEGIRSSDESDLPPGEGDPLAD